MDKATKGMLMLLSYCLTALVCILLGYYAGAGDQHTHDQLELNSYKEYYKATENLLDTLEKYDNWVDRFDPYDYYDAKSRL